MTPIVFVLIVVILFAAVIAALRVPRSMPAAPRTEQLAALAALPADVVARGRALHAELRPGGYASIGLALVVALLLGLTPLGANIVEACGRPFGGNWVAQALIGGFAVALVADVLTLPIAAHRETVLRRYGLSTRAWSGWWIDLVKGYAVGAVLGAVALLGFFGVARLAPIWWWAYLAGGAAILVAVLSFAFPVLVEPLFNRFTPMPDGEQREELLALAARDGVPVRDVLVADASRRTTALNAYVSGLGPTRRVVVYDTLLREATPGEVAAVVAHELGHAKDRDVVTGTLLGALGAAAGVCAIALLGHWPGLLDQAGVTSITEPKAVGLLLAIGALAGIVAAPLQNAVSRRVEGRADAHAMALTGDASTVEAMERRLATVNLADVDPPRLEYLLFASHPSVVERMAAARVHDRLAR